MKKGIKITAAAALAVSALTPVAALAAETTTTLDSGYYTESGFVSVKEFAAYTPSAKKAFIKENMSKNHFVFVLANNQVLDLKGDDSEEIFTALNDDELVKYSEPVEQYQEKNEVQITPEAIVDADSTPEENSIETFFYNFAA